MGVGGEQVGQLQRQVDAVTYADIATVELRDNVGDLFVDGDDELLAVMEARPRPDTRARTRARARSARPRPAVPSNLRLPSPP